MRSLVFVAGAGLASIVACGSQVTYVDPGSGGNASLLTAAMTTMSPNGGYLQIADTKGGVAKDITTINLDSAGRIYIDKKPVTFPELEQIVRTLLQHNPQQAVVIRGDEKVNYGKFVEIVDKLKLAGVTKLGIANLVSKNTP